MRCLTICIFAFSLLLHGGCWKASDPADAIAASNSPTKPEPAQPRQLDHEVLDAVLNDLFQDTGDDSPMGKTPEELTFCAKSVTTPLLSDHVLYQYREEPWARLNSNQVDLAGVAANDLVRRIESENWVVNFQPADNRVRLVEAAEFGDFAIEAWPPGFSSNRQTAIVRMVLPWSIHHVISTHILERDGDDWVVVLRQFVYYP